MPLLRKLFCVEHLVWSCGAWPRRKVCVGSPRAALATAAAVASFTILPHAARAAPYSAEDPLKNASEYVGSQSKNSEGDAAVFTPKAVIEGAGVKSSLVKVKMPDPGPLTAGDYVDTIYLRTSFGKIIDAAGFRSSGVGITEPVAGDASKVVPKEPQWKCRVEAGTGEVIPGIHTSKGLVWEGKPVFIK